MEFYENRAKRPFFVFVLIWRAWKKWYALRQTRRLLRRLSDDELRDIGLNRSDIG